jgi:DNA invertase Pin-like site-specific DNA recombinase
MTIKGIIYTRVSSDEQVKGTSLDFQEEICRTYCREKGIEVMALFREEGASAKTADRAQFLRAIEFCRKNKNKVTAFVVAKVDRFARNTEDHFYVRKILFDYGVTLHSVSEPIGNNPAGKFIETVLAGTSEFDNAVRRQRSVDGMISKIGQGIFPWKAPVGYLCAQSKKHGEKKSKPDEPDPKIFPIIQRGLKEYAQGKCSHARDTA